MKNVKRYLPYTHIGLFVLLLGYAGYFLMAAYFGGSADAFSGNGIGTPNDPYQISTCEQLQELNENTGGKTYVLVNDIDCSDSQNWPNGFESIPTFNASILDGRNHTINNIFIQEDAAYLGLFQELTSDAVVKNIRFNGGSIENTNPVNSVNAIHYTGTVAGMTHSTAIISNVHSNTTITTGSAAGGIVGQLVGTIATSRYYGNITSSGLAQIELGGIVARMEGGTIQDSFAIPTLNGKNPNLSAPHSCGGLVGFFWLVGGTVERSYSKGVIDCESTQYGGSGGLVGTLHDDARVKLTDSYSRTTIIQNPGYNGALIGSMHQSGELDGEIHNNYYDTALGLHDCIGEDFNFSPPAGLCVGVNVNDNPNYFGQPTNNPMAQWNFSTIWESDPSDPQTRPSRLSPYAPENTQASTVNYNSVYISWDSPLDNGGANITNYRISYKRTGDENWLHYGQVNQSTQSTTVTGLDSNTEYMFRVQAQNVIGYGLYSESVLSTTAVQPPESLDTPVNLHRTNVSPTSIEVSWNAVNEAGLYQVSYRASNAVSWTYTDPTTNLSFTATNLEPAKSYIFRVQAFNDHSQTHFSALSPSLTTSTLSANQIGISNCTELQNIQQDLSASYVLDSDINCSASANWNGGQGFIPIGDLASNTAFIGTLDGNGHTITGLTINTGNMAAAIFEFTQNATIQNLTLQSTKITATNSIGAATLIGNAATTNIYNVHSKDMTITSTGTSLIGGLAGSFEGHTKNISTSGTITSTATIVDLDLLQGQGYIGGIFGGTRGDNSITGATSSVEKATSNVNINVTLANTERYNSFNIGGIVGALDHTALTNAYAKGSITTASSSPVETNGITVAGIVGLIHHFADVNYVYASGTLTNAATTINGLAGAGGISGGIMPTGSLGNSFSTSAITVSENGIKNSGVAAQLTDDDGNFGNITNIWHQPENPCLGIVVNIMTGSFVGPAEESDECHEITDPTTYFNSRIAPPLDTWDFRDTWRVNATGLPTFTSSAISSTPANSTAISNCEQLQAIRENLNGTYHLINNIDCGDTLNWNNGQGFIPIGEGSTPFTGTFDGKNYTIKNVSINYTQPPREDIIFIRGAGLFGSVNTGTIQNLTLKDSTITSPQEFSNNTIMTGAVVGLTSTDSKFKNITVSNTSVYSGAFSGGVFGLILPSFINDPFQFAEMLLPSPNTQKRLKLEGIHFSGGSVDGVFAGGIVGITATGLNVAKNDPNAYGILITNSTSNATVRGINAGGIVGVSYSLGSDPVSYTFFASLANGNAFEILRMIDTVNPAINVCDDPSVVPELVREQAEFYCGLVAQNEGYELAVIGTRIENSSSTGLVTNCSNVIDFPLAILGGIASSGSGVEVRNSHSNATIATCPGTFPIDENAPDVTFGVLGGIFGISLDNRIHNSHYSGTIESNYNNTNSPFGGVTGGLIGLGVQIGDFNKKPMISNSYSAGTINLERPSIGISMSGGSIGLFIGAGTIDKTYSAMDIKTTVTKEVSANDTFGNFLFETVQGEREKLGAHISGGLIGKTIGLNFPAVINGASNFAEATFKDQNIKLGRDYSLGNARGLFISESYSKSNVNGFFSGGLIGMSNMSVDISKTYTEGEVTGTFAGGFIGNSGLIGTGLSVFNRTILGSEVDVCENGFGESFLAAIFIDTATCGFSQIDNLDPSQKAAITSANSVFKQIDIKDSYSKANITGVPVKVNVSIDLNEEEDPFLPRTIRGFGIPSFVGGLAGMYAPNGGSIQNVYTSGTIKTLPFTYTGEQTSANVFKPIPDMVGGFYGLNLATPEINVGRDNISAKAAVTKNSFSASKILPANPAWMGTFTGLSLKPLHIIDLVMNEPKNRPSSQLTEGIYYDGTKQNGISCDGVRNNKQAIIDIITTINPELGTLATDDIPNEFITESIAVGKCNSANTTENPQYFINNKTNAPLNTWNFNTTWKTRFTNYPDFIGEKISTPNDNNDGNDNENPYTPDTQHPSNTLNNWPTDIPVFGQSSSGDAPAVELGKLPRIGSSPFLITGLNAKVVQGLPWLLLLILSVLHLQQAWHQRQVNRRFKAAIALSERVKETLSGFMNITSHYLGTPSATISGALELLVGIKAIQGERAKTLTATAKELSKYINDLTKQSQEIAASTQKQLEIPNRETTALSMRKWVVIPVILAGLILTVSLAILNQIEVIEVTRTSLLLNIALLLFATSLVYSTFRIRLNQETANAALDRALAMEKVVVDQRKDLILEAESKLNSFTHQLALSNKTLEKSKNAKPYMNGLAELEIVTNSFHKVYKFATTNMPYASEVSPAILEALAPIRLEAKTRHINLITDIPPEINTVFSLEEAHHVIYSIMDNALKFSAEGSTVALTVRSDTHETFIQVQDHGIGIPKDKLDNLMQPFARATDTKKYNYEGMGLDLFITRILVEKYGGNIQIKSKIDEGTIVTIAVKK